MSSHVPNHDKTAMIPVKGVRTIDRRYAICEKIVKEALISSSEYNSDDIDFATPLICTGAANRQNLINFLLHIFLNSNTGRYSFTFNSYVTDAIKSRNGKGLQNLVNINPDVMFAELFSNDNISKTDRNLIKSIVDREYTALYNALEEAYQSSEPPAKIELLKIIPCSDKKIAGGLYQQCYSNVCLRINRTADPTDCNCLAMTNNIEPQGTIQIPIGVDPDLELPTVQCMDFIDFLKYLSTDKDLPLPKPLDRLTNDQVQKLRTNYQVEIAMYQYYIDHLHRKRTK